MEERYQGVWDMFNCWIIFTVTRGMQLSEYWTRALVWDCI